MKVAISSTGNSLQSKADPRFGRAPFFIFIEEDVEGGPREYSLENSAAEAGAGAGTEAAQQVVREGAGIIISGAVGPNAFEVFDKLGMNVFLFQGDIRVEDVYRKFKDGLLQRMVIKRL
jgi:predicted Fe-Mo cluster-binding NifX family protein